MTALQGLLIGIPLGATLSLTEMPAWFVVLTFVSAAACPSPKFNGRLAIMIGLLIGFGRSALIAPPLALPTESVHLTGAVRDIRESWSKTRYFLSEAQTTGSGQIALGAVVASVRSAYAEAEPGDRVELIGTLSLPLPYLAAQGVQATLEDAAMINSTSGSGSFLSHLSSLRRQAERHLELLLPLPESALLSGLLLGTDDRLPDDVAHDFRSAGLSHLTAVSGSNVALILSLMAGSLWWLPKRWHLLPLTFGIGAFTLLVGAPASAVRAALTGLVGLVALQSGRPGAGRSALIVVLAAMTLWEPRQLTNDAGFQLSFLATLGIVELGPLLKNSCDKFLPPFLAEALAVTLAAELPTLPWSAWIFARTAVIAPATNLLAAPLSGLATLSGLLLLGVSFACPPLILIIRPLAWLCLFALVQLAHYGASIGAILPDPGSPPTVVLLSFEIALFVAAAIWRPHLMTRDTKKQSAGHAMSPPGTVFPA